MGELTLDHDEEEDTHRENIHLSAIISRLFEDFRGDVARRAHGPRQLLEVARVAQAQVNQLEGHILVYQDVFKLEISMDHAGTAV